jgi:hypothetical protein
VPAERIAENLAFINWTVLTGLAVGASGAAVIGRFATAATRGYLAFTAIAAALVGVLAALSDSALPLAGTGSPVPLDPAWTDARHVALWAQVVLSATFGVALATGRRAPWLGTATLAAGAAALLAAALSWGGDALGSALLFVQLVVLAAAIGGVLAAMVLGHWYLVTPKLPEAPLVLFARGLAIVVAIQLVLFAVWTSTGAGPAGSPGFGALAGSWALFVWLRLIVGLVMPLVITWAALLTARTRSMESATGLLYIDVGLIAAGTILASGLYFGAGLLV